MPAVQVVNTSRAEPEPSKIPEFFSKIQKVYKDKEDKVEIDNLITQYQQNREDANAWEDLQLGLEKSNISPSKRLEAQKSLNETKKTLIAKDKAINSKFGKTIENAKDREKQKNNLVATGYTPEEADVYLDAPPSVKNVLEKNVRDEVRRKIRKLSGEKEVGQELPQGEAPTQENIESKEKAPFFVDEGETPTEKADVKEAPPEEWPTPVTPTKMTPAEQVKWENNNEKENNKELKETQTKKRVYANNDILINSMTKVNDSKKLPDGVGKLIIDPDTGDIRPEAQLAGLVNPETQLYVKNLKQWLRGAKDFFGARVTNFDVTSFMAQLPGLLNSEQGRRLILKQMKYVNDLESIHNNTLNEGLKKYGRNANYNQVVQVVDKKVSEREQDLLGKINNLVEASGFINQFHENPEKFRDHVLMQDREGKYRAVPKNKVEALKAKKWRDF